MQNVYFISGTMCTIDLWQFVFPKLQNINPIHIDITSASSFEEIDTIIVKSIEENAIIVGFSLGGFSAMHFAINYPQHIKKLVIIAADASGLDSKEIALRKSTIDFLEKHSYKGISQARVQQFIYPKNPEFPLLSDIIRRMDQDLGKKVLLQQLKATSQRIDITPQLLTLQIPMYFISAENDSIVPSENIKLLAQLIPKSKHLRLRKSGHMIPLEKPNELAEIIQLILKE